LVDLPTLTPLLQELSLAGNQLKFLPDCIGNLGHLQKLQLSGNYLESLPDTLCQLTALQVSVLLHCHNNPQIVFATPTTTILSVAAQPVVQGNSSTLIVTLLICFNCTQGFWAHGNLLRALPEAFGNLINLHTISLAGNRLGSLPKSISGLTKLQDLGLQGNELTEATAELGSLSKSVKQ